jgi:hypothetical protein
MIKALTIAVLLVAASIETGAAPEKQATLTTGLMFAPVSSGAFLMCNALNVSDAPLTMRVELIESQGTSVGSASGPVAPLQWLAISTAAHASGSCRVTVQGPVSAVRASICHWQNNGCIAHLEAR